MNILHLASEYPPQKVFGLGRYVRDLAEEQARAGHAVTVVTNSMGKEFYETSPNGVRVLRVDFPPPPKPPWNAGCVMIFNILLLRRLVGLGGQAIKAFDVVQSHDWLTALAAQAVQEQCGVPHVITFHDTILGKRLGKIETDQDGFTKAAEGWAASRAAHVIANSSATREELIRDYAADPARITVVPCAISPATFPVTDDSVRLIAFRTTLVPEDHALLLYVGRLDPEKGVDVLLNAFAQAGLPKAILCLAGSGGTEPQLREQVRRAGLEARVKFLGYVENPVLAHLYRVADVLISPSRYEPFGMVALEGMLQGTPVILSKTGGLADLIEDGKEGIFVIPGDMQSLADGLRRFGANRDKFRTMGERARATVLEKRTWAQTAAQVEAVYRLQARSPGKAIATAVSSLGVAAHLNDPYGASSGKWARKVRAHLSTQTEPPAWITTSRAPFFPVPTSNRDDTNIRDALNLAVDLLAFADSPPATLLATDWLGLLAGEVLRSTLRAPRFHYLPDPEALRPEFEPRKEEDVSRYYAHAQAWALLQADQVLLADSGRVAEVKKLGVHVTATEPISIPEAHTGLPEHQRDFFHAQLAEAGELVGVVALRLEPPFDPQGLLRCLEVIQQRSLPLRLLICGAGFFSGPLEQAVMAHNFPVEFLGELPEQTLRAILQAADFGLIPLEPGHATPFMKDLLDLGKPVVVPEDLQGISLASGSLLSGSLLKVDFRRPDSLAQAFDRMLGTTSPSLPVQASRPMRPSAPPVPAQTPARPAPSELVLFNDWGIGDELLLSAVGRELKAAHPQLKIWIRTRHGFPYPAFIEKGSPPATAMPVETIYQNATLYGPKHHSPFPGHLVQQMLDKVALNTGIKVTAKNVRPELVLRENVARNRDMVLLHCRPNPRLPSKDWGLQRWEALSGQLSTAGYRVVQVGGQDDPALPGAEDARGTALAELPTLFQQAGLVVCLVGMLMHLAAATKTPAIIIFGGREHPTIDGYPGHMHLCSEPLPCRGRWGCHLDPDMQCPHGMQCMEAITPESVAWLVRKSLPLPAEVAS